MDRRQVVEVLGSRSGSGLLLAERLVLTAAHLLFPVSGQVRVDERAAGEVEVRLADGADRYAARCVWARYESPDRGLDAALLEITSPAWPSLATAAVRWGELAGSAEARVHAFGFPDATVRAGVAELSPATGIVHTDSGTWSGRPEIVVDGEPERGPDGPSLWAGLSGGPVFGASGGVTSDVLLGIIVSDPEEFGSRRLRMISGSAILADPEAAAISGRHCGSLAVSSFPEPEVERIFSAYRLIERRLRDKAAQEHDGWLEDLKKKMRSIWLEEALTNSLQIIAAIELAFVERAEAVKVPMRQMEGGGRAFAKGTTLLEIFELDHTERRLLLLGQPGAGKTTQLLHLAEAMLQQNFQAPESPVPVYLPLTAGKWAEGIPFVRKSAPLAFEWFAKQISINYQIPRRKAMAWLTSNPCPIILLLDGLDEVPSENERSECLTALCEARFLTQAGMVVSCRTADYRNMNTKLNFGLAVEITPLTVEDIDAYLGLANVNLHSLRTAVSQDAALAALLDTPLMLCVASLAYKERDLELDLIPGSKTARQDQLWHSYIGTMVARRRNPQYAHTGNRRFSAEKTVTYLKFLALAARENHVGQFSKPDLTRAWLPGNWRNLLTALMMCRVLAVVALIVWYSLWIGPPNETDLLASVSVATGLAAAAACWSILIPSTGNEPDRGVGPTIIFFVGGFFPAALFGARNTPEGTVLFILIGGVLSALAILSITWWSGESGKKSRAWHTVPGRFIARVLTLTLCAGTGLYCLSVAHSHHVVLVKRIVTVDQSGCMAFVVVALSYAAEIIIDHYSTRIVFAFKGFLPLRLGSFWSHADERVLLRRIGSRYSFLHLELRDYLVRNATAGKPYHTTGRPR